MKPVSQLKSRTALRRVDIATRRRPQSLLSHPVGLHILITSVMSSQLSLCESHTCMKTALQEEIRLPFSAETCLDNRLLRSSTQNTRREEFTVTRNVLAVDKNENIVMRAKCSLEPCCYPPTDFGFSEFFGGGSEFSLFWRPASSLIRFFEQEHY